MKLSKFFLHMCLVSCLIFSCGEKGVEVSQKQFDNINKEMVSEDVVMDKSALQDYFETTDIEIDTLERTIMVSVSGSQLLLSKRRKMGAQWGGSEPWVSVAVTYQAKTINIDIDSFIYEVIMEGEKSRYSYSLEQLKKANHYLLICDKFARHLNNKEFKKIIKLLSSDITAKYNDVQLRNFIESTFGEGCYERIELIGTNTVLKNK